MIKIPTEKSIFGITIRIYGDCYSQDNIYYVKRQIEESEGIPSEHQNITYAGRQLENNDVLWRLERDLAEMNLRYKMNLRVFAQSSLS